MRRGGSRTLGLRAARGGRGPTLRGGLSYRGGRASATPSAVGRGVRRRDDFECNEDEVQEVAPRNQVVASLYSYHLCVDCDCCAVEYDS